MLLKKFSLALGPFCSYPSSQGLASSSSTTSMSKELCSSLDDLGGRPHYLGLVPLILRVQQLSFMIRYKGSLLHQPCERFSVGFQDLDLKIVGKILVCSFPSMGVHKVLVECRLCSRLLTFTVEFCNMLFGSTMHIFCRFAIVAGTFQEGGDITWPSSLKAAQARDANLDNKNI